MGSRLNNRYENPGHWEARFQEAALDTAQWLPVLGELAAATGSTRGELIGIGGNISLFNWISGVDDAMIEDFARHDVHRPNVNFRVAADGGTAPLTIVDEADYDRVRPTLTSDVYIELCERHHFPFGCQTVLMRGEDMLVGLALHRSRRDGRTTEQARIVFRGAAPAAQLGVRLQRALESQGLSLLAGTLEALSSPCLLLDGTGSVRAVTGSADCLLKVSPALQIAGGRLGGAHAEDDRRIQLALRETLREEGPASMRLGLRHASGGGACALEFIRLPRHAWAMTFAPRLLVRLCGAAPISAMAADRMCELFSLTRAEADIALALCRGQSREEIARSRGVSLETVKGQLKSLYLKTGCNRESQLVLLLRPLLD